MLRPVGGYFTTSEYRAGGVLRRWFVLMTLGDWNWSFPGVQHGNAENLTYNLMAWQLSLYSTFTDARSRSLHLAELYWGKCSLKWKAVQRAWYDVNFPYNYNCKPFHGATVEVFNSNVGSTTVIGIPKPHLKIGRGLTAAESTGIRNVHYSWTLPTSWYGHFNVDSSEYIIDSLTSTNSQSVKVIIHYLQDSIPTTDTITTIVHFSSECADNLPESRRGNVENPIMEISGHSSDNILLYPNPASNELNVTLPRPIKTTIEISNINGVAVYNTVLYNRSNKISLPILAPGIYFVKLQNQNLTTVKRLHIIK